MTPARTGARPQARTRVKAPTRAKARAKKPTRAKAKAKAPATSRHAARRSAQGRRSRVLLVVATVFAAAVVATSFPFSSLFGQRQQLAATQGQLDRLTTQNRALASEVLRLGDPATVAAIARADYGFVQPGQKAYDILPTAGAPLTSAANSGHVPLEGPPVSPGSAESQALLDAGAGGSSASTGPAGGSASGGSGPSKGSGKANGSGSPRSSQGSGLWARVLDTLEFWR